MEASFGKQQQQQEPIVVAIITTVVWFALYFTMHSILFNGSFILENYFYRLLSKCSKWQQQQFFSHQKFKYFFAATIFLTCLLERLLLVWDMFL